jgi:uncharacterized membrane protein
MKGILDWFVLFLVCSVLGWIVESTYRSLLARRPIDSGVLGGPFIPIYGFGALLVEMVDTVFLSQHLGVKLALCIILCTLLEFLVSLFYETVFHLRLWDYSKMILNIHGRVCLLYSLFWGLLGFVYLEILQAQLVWLVGEIRGVPILGVIFIGLTVMFAMKVISSFSELGTIKAMKETLLNQFGGPGLQHVLHVGFHGNRRILVAFPNLIRSFVDVFLQEVNRRANLPTGFFPFRKAVSILFHGSPVYDDWEDWLFFLSIEDLLANKAIQSMSNYRHHHVSTLDHVMVISQASWYLAEAFGLDKDACARGALLHDFFLYDWRDKEHPHHATMHAGIALKNAHRYFNLDEMEKDIILTHMWPLSDSFFKYRESVLVSLVDKIGSTRDIFSMISGINEDIAK